MAAISAVGDAIATIRSAHPGLRVTCAPQMTDVFPDLLSITAGFNRYVPILDAAHASLFDVVMPQMCASRVLRALRAGARPPHDPCWAKRWCDSRTTRHCRPRLMS